MDEGNCLFCLPYCKQFMQILFLDATLLVEKMHSVYLLKRLGFSIGDFLELEAFLWYPKGVGLVALIIIIILAHRLSSYFVLHLSTSG